MSDLNIPKLNLTELHRVFYEESTAPKAAKLLSKARAGKSKVDLNHLLRHHDEETIKDKETYQRDALDDLLAFYGLVEIACQIDYVPERLPVDLVESASLNLGEPAVLLYYESHYPLTLPMLFRLRLNNTMHLDIFRHNDSGYLVSNIHALYADFLCLVSRYRDDVGVETFLWFLDDGDRDGYDISDTLGVLQDPNGMAKHLVKKPSKRDALDYSVRGFAAFLNLCAELDRLLSGCEGFPLLQASMWHFYAYWFRNLRDKVGRRLGKAIGNISSWPSEIAGRNRLAAEQAKQIFGEQMEGILVRLLSDKYGSELNDQIAEKTKLRGSRKLVQPVTSQSLSMLIDPIDMAVSEVVAMVQPMGQAVTWTAFVGLVQGVLRRQGLELESKHLLEHVRSELKRHVNMTTGPAWLKTLDEDAGKHDL